MTVLLLSFLFGLFHWFVGMPTKPPTHTLYTSFLQGSCFEDVARRLVWFWHKLTYLSKTIPDLLTLPDLRANLADRQQGRHREAKLIIRDGTRKKINPLRSHSLPPTTLFFFNSCVLYNYAPKGRENKTNLTHNMMMLLLHFAVNFTILTENT